MRLLARLTCATVLYAASASAQVVAPARNTVRTDDGHSLVVWSKTPEGAPKGEIILLHGRTWSALPNFDLYVGSRSHSLMDALVAEGYAVYAVDQRGYGASARDASGWLTPDRAARDAANVVEWVTQQSPRRRAPVLFGYSRGAMTSFLAAQRRPRAVTAVILYGYPFNLDVPYDPPKDPARPPRERTTAEGAGEDFITPDSLPAGVKAAYVRSALEHDPIRVDWRREQQWKELNAKKLTVPTLFISGEGDPYANDAGIGELLQAMPSTDREWVVLSHADHAAHLERQAAFVRALTAFLGRTLPR